MCRRTEEVGPAVGLPRHKHFVWFFNVPVKAPTTLFTVIPRTPPPPPISIALLRRAWGYVGSFLILNLRVPRENKHRGGTLHII